MADHDRGVHNYRTAARRKQPSRDQEASRMIDYHTILTTTHRAIGDGPGKELIKWTEIEKLLAEWLQRAEAERDAARAELAPIVALLDPNESSGIPIAQLVKAMLDELNTARAELAKALDSAEYHRHTYLGQQTEIDNLRAALNEAVRVYEIHRELSWQSINLPVPKGDEEPPWVRQARAALDAKEQTK